MAYCKEKFESKESKQKSNTDASFQFLPAILLSVCHTISL